MKFQNTCKRFFGRLSRFFWFERSMLTIDRRQIDECLSDEIARFRLLNQQGKNTIDSGESTC